MAFGLLLNSYPYFILGMALAWNHLRYGRQHALSVMAAAVALHTLSVILLTYSLPLETLRRIQLTHDIVYMGLILALLWWIVKIRFRQILFMALFVKHIADFAASISLVSTPRLFPNQPIVSFGLHYNIVHLALLCLIFPLMLWFIRQVLRKLYDVESTLWRFLWIVPAVFYALNTLLFVNYRNSPYVFAEFMLLIAALFGISLMMYTLTWKTLQVTREKILKEENERRLTDENAALDRANRMRTDLIATVTHETMTPLAVLSGYSELVAKELRRKYMDEQIAKDLDTISEETQRIKWLMNELLNHTSEKDSELIKTKLDLAKLAENTARLYTPILERKNTTLALRFPDDLPDVYACANEITQVLFNLIQNSRNHTDNGSVTVTAIQLENEEAASRTVRMESGEWRVESGGSESVESGSQFVEITVADTGSGIAPELLRRVFERGITGSGRGMGLGLPICKEIIEAHGGKIGIVSKISEGTKVWFTIPVYSEDMSDIGDEDEDGK